MIQNSISTTTILAREAKIRALRYKVTIFIVAFLLFALWPQIQWLYDNYIGQKQVYAAEILRHEAKVREHTSVLKDAELLQKISTESQKSLLAQCYNTNCSTLPEEIKNEPVKSAVKAYLQLQQTAKTKFTIDQKKVLAYLNEFLIRSADGTTTNGNMTAVTFGAPALMKDNVSTIPMSLTMTFANKQWLFGFLRNIEQLISPTFPMYAVVESVSYDIMNVDTPQWVTVTILIYMLE